MGAGADGTIQIYTDVDMKGIQNGTKQIESSMNRIGSMVKKIGGVIAAAFAVREIIQFGKESSQAARVAADSMKGLESILKGQGRSFSDAKDFIDEYINDGLIPATNATNAYKNLASRGYDDSQIKEVLTALKDASAYGRQSSLTMGQAVESATEGLKNENSILVDNAGVTKNVAKMWEEYAASIGTTSNNLTQQQKIQAEVTGILTETRYQMGDAAKVANSLSGEIQRTSFNLNNLKIAVGNIINPFVQVFLPVINTAITAVTRLANAIAHLVNTFFGTSMNAFADETAGVTSSYDSAAAGAENYAGATSDAANATKEAQKAAKGYLSSLDEIKTLNTDSGASSGGSSGGGGGGISGGSAVDFGSVEQGESVVDQVNSSFDELFAILKENLQPLTEQLNRFGGIAKDAFTWLLNNVLKPLASFTISEVVPRFFETLANALFVINNILIALQPLWQWFWDNVLLLIATWTAGVFLSAWDSINVALKTFGEWCAANPEIVQTIAIAIASFFAAFKITKTVDGIKKMVKDLGGMVGIVKQMKGLISTVLNPWTIAIAAIIAIGVLLYKNWDTIKAKAIEIWGSLKTWFSETTQKIGDYFKNLWTNIKAAFAGVGEWFKVKFETAYNNVTNAFRNVATWFKTKFELAYSNIKTAFSNIGIWFGEKYEAVTTAFGNVATWFEVKFKSAYTLLTAVFEGIGDWFKERWGDIKGVFKNIGTWFEKKFQGAYSKITGIFDEIGGYFEDIWDGVTTYISGTFLTNWKLAWNSVKSALSSVWTLMVTTVKTPINSIIGLINSMINAVETGLNWIIGGANKISFSIPEWVPEIGGNTFGINIPLVDFASIPLLAQGAVIPANKEFLAVLGDQKHGQNLEAPEGLIRKIVREESGKGGGVIKLIVQLNRRTIYEELISEAKLRQMQTGSNPFDLA